MYNTYLYNSIIFVEVDIRISNIKPRKFIRDDILYMETKSSKNRNHSTGIFIASLWLFFSCIYIINAGNESSFYDKIWGNITDTRSTIGKKIINIQNTLQANEAIKKQEYEKALQLISWNKSEDYYNRGTIQTLLAYKNALQSNISGLEVAQKFVIQAQQNLDIAKKLSPSIKIQQAIIDNEGTINTLSKVVDIKTCYGIWQTTIVDIKDIIDNTIKNIKNTLDQEEIYINKRAKSLPNGCYEKLTYILDTSRQQVWLLQIQMGKNITKYTSDFSQKIEDPILCITTPYENIIPSIAKGKEWLEAYQLQHINTTEALKNNENIKELCDQSKNDAQINQKIESAIQELLEKLEGNTWEKKQQQRNTDKVEYKDFFNKDEQKILQDIKNTNQWWIETILHIRGKGSYDPEKYINDMFNQFYGNSWDFIDLHK